MTEQKYWPNCETCIVMHEGSISHMFSKPLMFCPSCGAMRPPKRPEPPKDWLMDAILNTKCENYLKKGHSYCAKAIAQAIREEIAKRIDDDGVRKTIQELLGIKEGE